jgi:hypothetical protein
MSNFFLKTIIYYGIVSISMEKGQGAIEYLLIIAAAILVVAIVILAVTGALSGGQDQAGQAVGDQNDAFDALQNLKNKTIAGQAPAASQSQLVTGLIALDNADNDSGTIDISGDVSLNYCLGDFLYEVTLSNPDGELVICENGCTEENGYGECK